MAQLAVADARSASAGVEEVCRRPAASAAVHKTANVLNKLPKSQQSKAKRALQTLMLRPRTMRSCVRCLRENCIKYTRRSSA